MNLDTFSDDQRAALDEIADLQALALEEDLDAHVDALFAALS